MRAGFLLGVRRSRDAPPCGKIHATQRPGAYSRAMPLLLPLVVVLLLLLPPGDARGAQGEVNATGDYLARMDADRDGRVSLLEYQDWLSYAFDAMDRSGDARLTPDELPGGKGKVLTREQHRKRLADTFRKQDANRDGYLSARELAAPPR